MKYLDYAITFLEFPDEIALCINITNCPFHCSGCHSPELWEDIGTKLTVAELDGLIKSNKGITCIGFMGGSPKYIKALAKRIRTKYPKLKIGYYYGGDFVFTNDYLKYLDYIKIGPYIKERGGLNNPNTNQKMFWINHLNMDSPEDITYKFWKHGE